MRINAYWLVEQERWWISLGRLAVARMTNETVQVVAHSRVQTPTRVDAWNLGKTISDGVNRLQYDIRLAVRESLVVAVLYAALALLAVWPPLRGATNDFLLYTVLAVFAVGASSRLLSCYRVSRVKGHAIRWCSPLWIRGSGSLLPPVQAYADNPRATFSVKIGILTMILVVAAVALNSVVIATPDKPAVIGNRVISGPELVLPGTHWEHRQLWTTSTVYVAFADGENDTIHAVKISYALKHTNLVDAPADWDTWMITTMNSTLGRLVEHVWGQYADPAYTVEEKKTAVVEAVRELEGDLAQHMTTEFEKVADGVLLWTINVSEVELTIAEYRDVYIEQSE